MRVVCLRHEEAAALRAHIALRLSQLSIVRLLNLSCGGDLDAECFAGSLLRRLITGLGTVADGCLMRSLQGPRTRAHHVKLLPHDPVFLFELFDLWVLADHLLELGVLFFEDQELLVEVVSAAFPF